MTVARSSSLPKLGVAVALMTTLKSAVDGRFNQMHTRENLRKQYDRWSVVRKNVLNMPETTDTEIYHFLRNRHFGATSFPMKRGNHEVAVINPDAMLRKLIEQACEACDVTPFGSSRLVWYRDGNSTHTAHHDPTGGQVQPTVTLIANQRDVLA
jgi:hypothetical protein